MAKNQILTSSDHHANWDALEKLFQIAKDKEIPFIINGDIIGDYNFEELRIRLRISYPYETNHSNNLMGELKTSMNLMRLKALYQIIVKFHAKKLAELIDKYNVRTYFLLGNHEPINFVDLTIIELKNKDLIKDLGKIEKVENANGIKIAGIPNVSAVMPFIREIYTDEEVNKLFKHQFDKKPILFKNITKENLKLSENHKLDSDWTRIAGNEQNPELDVFFTHGQIGRGAWRNDKHCEEMPTLHSAAKLSEMAKLTIDGHLHTTHKMMNPIGKKTLRAVGNKAFILTKKENGDIEEELLEADADYDHRGKADLSHLDLDKEILKEISKK